MKESMMKVSNRILTVLHFLVGVGGMAGGLAAITEPMNPMGVPVSILENSPFNSFLIPGILLFAIIGVGNIFCGVVMLLKWKYRGYTSSVVSWGPVIWIIVQCVMLRSIVFLHVLFFLIGLVQAALSMHILMVQKQFPTNILIDIMDRLRGGTHSQTIDSK